MISVVIFGIAVATATVAQEVNPDATTDVALNGGEVPATITTENGVIMTNGTLDKRCWVFMPFPVQSNQNQPNNPRRPYPYFYNMYANNFRYPYFYYYGRRPGRRPNNNSNNNNNNQNLPDDLPVFGADGEQYVQNGQQFIQNGMNGQQFPQNGQQFPQNGQQFLQNGMNGQDFPVNGQQFGDYGQQFPGNGQQFGDYGQFPESGADVNTQAGFNNNNVGGEVVA